jgi:cytochrome c553
LSHLVEFDPTKGIALAFVTSRVAAIALIGFTLPVHSTPKATASDLLARSVCAACHGASGISVADHIPNLAGQRVAYLSAQLTAFKEGSRKNEIMNPIAAQLDNAQLANVAAYFASLPASASTQKSALLDVLRDTRVSIPENYRTTFTRYRVVNDTDTKSLSSYYANSVALAAARADASMPLGAMIITENAKAKLDARGNAILDKDGHFVAERVTSFAAMATGENWGERIPEMLRNGNWNYAMFGADRVVRNTINHAECFACHKALTKTDYLFTRTELAAAAKRAPEQR